MAADIPKPKLTKAELEQIKQEVLGEFKKKILSTALQDKELKAIKESLIKRELRIKKTKEELYESYKYLSKETRERLDLTVPVPVYIQDPWVAQENPDLGVEEIQVKWEPGFSDGPTSARIAVVDFNGDTGTLTPPARWDEDIFSFTDPAGKPIAKDDQQNLLFHQLNVWAIVQRVLEFYEDAFALGRPIPWGFEGNRLIIVPHAGYGENAFYDRHSHSLQFYYYGEPENPRYTCLSHDVITHETGHAVLDGIRPFYYEDTSVETGAFHEFIGDFTAILVAFHNKDVREAVKERSGANLENDSVLASLAEDFGHHVNHIDYLRTAQNLVTMQDIAGKSSPHDCSQVLTGMMFDVLKALAQNYTTREKARSQPVTPGRVLSWTANTIRSIALQALDLCPPADIRFMDYAQAVLRNYKTSNAADEQGYIPIMLEIFHQRGMCSCGYLKEDGENIRETCAFWTALRDQRLYGLISHDIGSIARSRTAAYYYLHDNRAVFKIPKNVDLVVTDLYETNKSNAAGVRLPRQIVLEYIWREEVAVKGQKYGKLDGSYTDLLCGGTLVFDERGNILSWFRKPGAGELIKPDPEELKAGEQRKKELLEHIARRVKGRRVGLSDDPVHNRMGPGIPEIQAYRRRGVVHLQVSPHLKESGEREVEWESGF